MPASVTGSHLRRLWSAEGISLLMALAQGLVVARALGPHLYGVYALIATFAGFVFVVLDPRTGDAMIRFIAEFRSTGEVAQVRAVIRGALLLDLIWALAGFAIACVVAIPAASVMHIPGYAGLIPIAALGLAFATPLATSRAILGAFERFELISGRQIVVSTIRASGVCAVAWGGLGLMGVIAVVSTVSFIECVLFAGAALKVAYDALGSASILRAPLGALRGHRQRVIRFLAYTGSTATAGAAIKQVDTLLVGAIAGTQQAGFYRLAKSLVAPAANIANPIQAVLYPPLADAEAAGDTVRAGQIIRHASLRFGAPLAVMTLAGAVLVGPAVRLTAGTEFDGAVAPTIALVIGVAISFATLHLRPMFLARDQVRSLMGFSLAVAVASVVAFVPSAAWLGATGVAWARTIALGIGAVAMAVWLSRTSVVRREAEHGGSAAEKRR